MHVSLRVSVNAKQCISLHTGTETTRTIGADVSSYIIDGLRPNSAYTVQVSTLVGSREGTPAILRVRTGVWLNFSIVPAFRNVSDAAGKKP